MYLNMAVPSARGEPALRGFRYTLPNKLYYGFPRLSAGNAKKLPGKSGRMQAKRIPLLDLAGGNVVDFSNVSTITANMTKLIKLVKIKCGV
jgi:hypothetical protein